MGSSSQPKISLMPVMTQFSPPPFEVADRRVAGLVVTEVGRPHVAVAVGFLAAALGLRHVGVEADRKIYRAIDRRRTEAKVPRLEETRVVVADEAVSVDIALVRIEQNARPVVTSIRSHVAGERPARRLVKWR